MQQNDGNNSFIFPSIATIPLNMYSLQGKNVIAETKILFSLTLTCNVNIALIFFPIIFTRLILYYTSSSNYKKITHI